MLFADVIGQSAAKSHLLGMWQQNHLPHALLLYGAEGTGALPLAVAVAQYILCLQKNSQDACGQCPNCIKIAKMEHADVHFSFPSIRPNPQTKILSTNYIKEFRKFLVTYPYGTTYDWLQYIRAENKQGSISADDCRAIIELLSLKSYEGSYKILIMWRPEYLGKEGNILLKMIEEPPANTVIILVAESLEEILPTILSRVQMIKLNPLSEATIEQSLIQKQGIESNKASQIALMADGSYGAALSLMQHLSNDQFPLVRQFFNLLFTNNGLGIAKFVEDMAKNGREQQKNFLKYVIHLLEATLKARFTGQSKLLNEELAFVQKLAAFHISFEVLAQLISIINKTSYYIQRNGNSKIQLLAMSIKMMHSIQNKKVSSLS